MNRFKELRTHLELTQEQIAKKLKRSTSCVSKWECEPPRKIMDRMEKMVKNFGIVTGRKK